MNSAITRRGLLGGVLAMMAAASVCHTPFSALAETPRARHPLLGGKFVGDGPGGLYTAPFTVTESSVLSQDYFLTDLVLVDPATDRILPFSRADGSVEALVLQQGSVSHLARDASTTTGWTYTVLTPTVDNFASYTTVLDAGVATGPDGTVYALLLMQQPNTPHGGQALALWAVLAPAADTWECLVAQYNSTVLAASSLGQVRSGVDSDGGVYLYAFYTATTADNGTFLLWRPQWTWECSAVNALNGITLGELTVDDAWLVYNTGNTGSTAGGGVMVKWSGTGVNTGINWFPQTSATTFSRSQTFSWLTQELLWADWSADPSAPLPAFLVLGNVQTGLYYFNDLNRGVPLAKDMSVTPDQVAVWYTEELVSFAVLNAGTLNVVVQYGDAAAEKVTFTPPIPIASGVEAVVGLTTDQNQATLFVVNEDTSLSVLAKDPTLGTWTNTPVHQASSTMLEMTMWRAQLTVTDANGVAVSATDVRITADRAFTAWQASGNTYLDPAHPATMTTNAMGRITFAFPAIELDTAILSAQVMSNGSPTGDPIPVRADAGVHTYLAGRAPLNDLPTMTGASLVAAQNPDGSALFPVLDKLSGDDQTTAANGVAQAVNQCIVAGQGTPAAAVKSFTMDFSGSVPTYTSSGDPGAARLQSSSWWDSAVNDAGSVFHAIRHGLADVVSTTAEWSEDAGHWVVNMAITIGDDVSTVISYAITDLKSAVHAVCGFFHALGADIVSALQWLEHNVLGVLLATQANAAIVEGWLSQASDVVVDKLKGYEDLADNYFRGLENEYVQAVQDIEQWTKGMTFGTPTSATGVQDVGSDIMTVINDIRSNWLLDKITEWFGGSPSFPTDSATQGFAPALLSAVTDNLSTMEDLAKNLWDIVFELVAEPSDFANLGIDKFFTALENIGVDLLTFADAIVDDLLNFAIAAVRAFDTLLDGAVNEVPFIGGLLRHLGIDDTATVGHFFSLACMFPPTFAYHMQNPGQPLFPGGQAVTRAADVEASLDWADGLRVTAAVLQGFWAFVDYISDSAAVVTTPPRPAPGWVAYVDFVMPVIMSVVQWPGAPYPDGSTAPPFATDIPSTGPSVELIFPGWLLGFAPTAVTAGAYLASDYMDDNGGTSWSPYITSALAVGATLLSCLYNFRSDASGGAKVAGILGNVSNVVAPFVTKPIVDDSEGISAGIKLVVDLVGNLGAAVAIGNS